MMAPPMYDALYVLHNLAFACFMIGLMYSFYYLDMTTFFYTILFSSVVFSVLYIYSKKRPIKRRHSDYEEDDIPLDSNA